MTLAANRGTNQFASSTYQMLSLNPAEQRDVESLQNWLDGNGCLAKEESAYLAHCGELVSLAPTRDSAILQLENWVETRLIRLWRNFRKSRFHNMSNDPNVYIHSGQLIQRIAKALLLLLITILLLMPVVVCSIINTTSVRIAIVMVSTISYLLVLSSLTKSRTMELILAGATYATVLTVFVSNTSVTQV